MISTIKCPICGRPIEFDIHRLMTGDRFQCAACSAVISLSASSSQVVQDAMHKLDELKKGSVKASVE